MGECSGQTSCEGATFVVGANVNIVSVKCAFGACAGCLIKETLADIGMPCDPSLRTTSSTAAPAPSGVIGGPVVELPIGSISLPGIGNGIVAPPTTATSSPPLNIVLPPLPGANPNVPAPVTTAAPVVPSIT